MFSQDDIAEYYNTTQIHYEKWWNLKKGLSLHYGIWDKHTKNFTESLRNTNQVLMSHCGIADTDKVLDAGCGVGGAAIFINLYKNNEVTGITLSEKQVAYANNIAKERQVDDKVKFLQMDYTKTDFADESFDVVWACESVSSVPDKSLFVKEAFRVLKKGGKLILSDCFLTDVNQKDPKSWVKKWGATWGVSNLITADQFCGYLTTEGFTDVQTHNYTSQIRKSAKRMYNAALMGFFPSETYNLFHPKVSRFAKHHYRSGYYQYKALKKDLWKYVVIYAEKG